MLPLNLSDTAATSQDGSSLEFIAAIAGRQCYIQDASGRGLWLSIDAFHRILKGMARYAGQLLAPAEGFSFRYLPDRV